MAGIYLHIPFCKQACHYCDFHFSTSLKYRDELLQALIKELELQRNYLGGETVETIYFGGGTPSLLHAAEINAIVDAIVRLHTISANAEITLEANPDDLDKQKINDLRTTAVNRFSIGIQSFFDEDLKWMNRAHNAGEAESSVKRAQDAGFENITADLIYGYPLLTDAKWKQNIETMFALDIPHISAYSLTVEPRTALASFIKKKTQPPISDEQSAAQFMVLMDAMEQQGFQHYEISNYCKPGHYSRHNSNYWKGVKYLGVGPSAHSFNGETRQWTVANNALYISKITDSQLPTETEELTEENRLNEYVMTALRTMWGLNLEHLNNIAKGASAVLLKAANQFLERQWLQQEGNTLYLTKEGKLYADHIAGELFF